MSTWTQQEGIAFCAMLEAITPKYGCHVGLTGGLLYKEGPRKDCDVILYRIRQAERIQVEQLLSRFALLGVETNEGFGFCYKGTYKGKRVDFLLPEEAGNSYQEELEAVAVDPFAF